MQLFQSKTRSDGYHKIRSETRTSQSTSKTSFQDIIDRANTVPLALILKFYGYRVPEHDCKLTCPFHGNGRENTPSFQYYQKTNSFWCFGCKVGRMPVDFVAKKDGINNYQAAKKIIDLYGSEVSIAEAEFGINYTERLEILMEFSDFVRGLLQTSDMAAISRIEQMTFTFDRINEKYSMNNECLRIFILELKERIE